MLLKDLLKVLVTARSYTIRIGTVDNNTIKTIKDEIFNMDKIPDKYLNSKVLTIHSSGTYDNNLCDYSISIYK